MAYPWSRQTLGQARVGRVGRVGRLLPSGQGCWAQPPQPPTQGEGLSPGVPQYPRGVGVRPPQNQALKDDRQKPAQRAMEGEGSEGHGGRYRAPDRHRA